MPAEFRAPVPQLTERPKERREQRGSSLLKIQLQSFYRDKGQLHLGDMQGRGAAAADSVVSARDFNASRPEFIASQKPLPAEQKAETPPKKVVLKKVDTTLYSEKESLAIQDSLAAVLKRFQVSDAALIRTLNAEVTRLQTEQVSPDEFRSAIRARYNEFAVPTTSLLDALTEMYGAQQKEAAAAPEVPTEALTQALHTELERIGIHDRFVQNWIADIAISSAHAEGDQSEVFKTRVLNVITAFKKNVEYKHVLSLQSVFDKFVERSVAADATDADTDTMSTQVESSAVSQSVAQATEKTTTAKVAAEPAETPEPATEQPEPETTPLDAQTLLIQQAFASAQLQEHELAAQFVDIAHQYRTEQRPAELFDQRITGLFELHGLDMERSRIYKLVERLRAIYAMTDAQLVQAAERPVVPESSILEKTKPSFTERLGKIFGLY